MSVSTSDGLVEWTRPALGGNILAEIICPEHRPQMGSVRPNVFKMPERQEGRQGHINKVEVQLTDGDIRNRFVEMIKVDMNDVNIEEAEIIVAGGRGMGSPENFKVLEELADALRRFKGTILVVSHEPEFYRSWITDEWNVESWTTKIV